MIEQQEYGVRRIEQRRSTTRGENTCGSAGLGGLSQCAGNGRERDERQDSCQCKQGSLKAEGHAGFLSLRNRSGGPKMLAPVRSRPYRALTTASVTADPAEHCAWRGAP